MEEREPVALRDLTTLRVGGASRRLLVTTTEADVAEAVTSCDASGEPVLLLGGGSNLVVANEGFPGAVVLLATAGVKVRPDGSDHVLVDVAGGEPWDALVERSVGEGWSGLEALSGIPGLTGATPVQNVGAYGQEVAQTVVSVRVLDRGSGTIADLPAPECAFGYRTSRFKGHDGAVVLRVTFRLERSELSGPLRYPEVARHLGAEVGARVPASDVRATVVALRRSKGMVLDPADPDTSSVGSFFTNPLLDRVVVDRLPDDAPRYGQADGTVKTSAAWLIEQAGFQRGYGHGDARISTKHTLALTNRGQATANEILDLAREVRDGVSATFGIDLETEPRLVGLHL